MVTDDCDDGDGSSTGGTGVRVADGVYRLVPPDDAPGGAGKRHEYSGGLQEDGSFLLIDRPAPYYTGPRPMRDQSSDERLERVISEAGFDPEEFDFQ